MSIKRNIKRYIAGVRSQEVKSLPLLHMSFLKCPNRQGGCYITPNGKVPFSEWLELARL